MKYCKKELEMKKESGITLISLVIALMIMTILAGILINATMGENTINKQKEAENNLEKLIDKTDNKIEQIQNQWDGVI